MAYEVEIIDTATGERRVAKIPYEWGSDDGDAHWWTEGNFGCDCNRGMVFDKAGGQEPGEHPCWSASGKNRFRVTFAHLPDGRKVEIDGEPPSERKR